MKGAAFFFKLKHLPGHLDLKNIFITIEKL